MGKDRVMISDLIPYAVVSIGEAVFELKDISLVM